MSDASIRGAIAEENYQSWVTSSKRRSSSLRTMLARRISASASGSWPTSRAEDSESCGNHGEASDALNAVATSWPTPNTTPSAPNGGLNRGGGIERQRLTSQCLEDRAASWPTPTIGESKDAARQTTQTRVMHDGTTLTDAARMWPTPTETELGNTPENYLAMKANMTSGSRAAVTHLPIFAQLWTTPQAHDESGGDPARVRRFGTTHGGANLADDVTQWSTPQAHDIKNVSHETMFTNLPSQVKTRTTPTAHNAKGTSPSEAQRTTPDLEAQACSHLDPTTTDGPPSSPSPRTSRPRLNPAFTAWLLGLPWWWTNPAVTSSARSAMAAYRRALRQHLAFLLSE